MELPKFARIIKNEQVTLCSVFNKYHSFIIFQQLAEDEERIFWSFIISSFIFFIFFSIEDSLKTLLFPHYLADRFRTLSRLTMIKNQQRPDQNHSSRQQTPQPKPPWVCYTLRRCRCYVGAWCYVGACSWCCRNLENTNKFSEIWFDCGTRESLKKVGCRNHLLSLVRIVLRLRKPVYESSFCAEFQVGRRRTRLFSGALHWEEWVKPKPLTWLECPGQAAHCLRMASVDTVGVSWYCRMTAASSITQFPEQGRDIHSCRSILLPATCELESGE